MVFWRKKKNQPEQEQEDRDNRLLHRDNEPDIEPPTEYEADFEHDPVQDEIRESGSDIIEDLDETPTPDGIPEIDEALEEPEEDENAGGWFSRLTQGLSKSSNKITQGLTDILTKSKLDQEMLDQLEEVLIEADLGPKTAMRVIEDFSKDRFGKDITEEEIKSALAEVIENIVQPVAQRLDIVQPEKGPFVVLVCGVNGAGKTTTIGKYTQQLRIKENKKVMIAAADTFRAAAIDQLAEWAKRSDAEMFSKDVGSDAASVAYEAYQEAIAKDIDVLMIDTAGRLQNKSNLMDELQKIVRVLKKQDESIPHSVLLVLDSTTGQNAYSQVETFKEMVDVTGLIVTKLDGSAKGGVLVGLADQFGVPVHAIGVGEKIEDLKAFSAKDYAHSLLGLELTEAT